MKFIEVANEIVAAVRVLSRHRLGSIIVLGPAAPIVGGTVIDAVVTRELLVAIAIPESLNQLHRGAVVISGDRIERVAVPISWAGLKGAVGLTAGVAISVDEDMGKVRIMNRTGYVEVVDVDDLVSTLRRHTYEADRR